MILKGNQRAGGIDLATHLLNSFDNETVEVAEIRGAVARDLLGAFSEFEAVASGTRCRQPFYSLSINPPRPLTRGQYQAAIDRIETALGLVNQPRAIIFHCKDGREHCHVVWSRVAFRKMTAVQLSHDRLKLKNLSRELALSFGFPPLPGFGERPATNPADHAQQAATGVSPEQRRQEITEALAASDNGRAFEAALSELGYSLARGDRRCLVVVDRYGHVHSLTRQIEGARTKHILARLAPLRPEELPSAEEVKRCREEHDPDAEYEHRDRLMRVLRRNHARRRARLYRDIRDLEARQQAELSAVLAAQGEERDRPVPRLVSAVFRLVRSYPALRSILGPIHRLTRLRLAERHALELESIRRRHGREWLELQRQERLLRLLAAKERRSLENAIWRALRRSKRKAEQFHLNAIDVAMPSIFSPFAEDGKTPELDPELAALEREYMQEATSFSALFNEAAGLSADNAESEDGDDRAAPSLSGPFNDRSS